MWWTKWWHAYTQKYTVSFCHIHIGLWQNQVVSFLLFLSMKLLPESVWSLHFLSFHLEYLSHFLIGFCYPSWTIPILWVFPKFLEFDFGQGLNCDILLYFQFLMINSCSRAHFWFVCWIRRFIRFRRLIFRSIFLCFEIKFWLTANFC